MKTSSAGKINDLDVEIGRSEKWPELLAHMAEAVEGALVKAGAGEKSSHFADVAVLAIGNSIGGRMQYIPRGDRLATAVRHAQAWRLWKGNNIEEVTEFLGVSEIRAYAVLAEQRKLHRSKDNIPDQSPPVQGKKGILS